MRERAELVFLNATNKVFVIFASPIGTIPVSFSSNIGHMASMTTSMTQGAAASAEGQLAFSEELASSSRTLAGVASELKKAVSAFKL